jgi:hypothetical protein
MPLGWPPQERRLQTQEIVASTRILRYFKRFFAAALGKNLNLRGLAGKLRTTYKMLFRFENLSIKPGARDSWNVPRGTIREMWESFLERYNMPDEALRFRNSEHLLSFSTIPFGHLGREVLGWDDIPAASSDFLWARYNLSQVKWRDDHADADAASCEVKKNK